VGDACWCRPIESWKSSANWIQPGFAAQFRHRIDDLVKQIGIFDSPEKSDRVYLEAKNRMLSAVIRNFPGVANASSRSIRPASAPGQHVGAAVGDGDDHHQSRPVSAKQLAESARRSSAARRLDCCAPDQHRRRRRAFDVQDKDSDSGNMRRRHPRYASPAREFYRDKIRAEFQDIPNLLVSVTVNLNTASKLSVVHDVDPKKFVSVRRRRRTSRSNRWASPPLQVRSRARHRMSG